MAEATPASKCCGSCRRILPLEAFNRRAASTDGRMARCRACDSEYKKAHRAGHPEQYREMERKRYQGERRERILAASRARYLADPEKWNADRRAKWAADPQTARAKQNAYKTANHDRVKAWRRRYYQRHADKIRAQRVAEYAANPEKFIARILAYQRAHPEQANQRNHRYRARKAGSAIGEVTVTLLASKLAYWGWRCWMCGGEPTDWDHVKPLAKSGAHMLANLRPACDPCNSRKRDRWPFPTRIAAAVRTLP